MKSQQRAANLLSPAVGNERGLTLGSTMRRWLAATALVGGLVATGSPAIAAQTAPSSATHTLSTQQQAQAAARDFPGMKAVPDAVGDESQICLTNAPKYCIKTNGPGNPVTITNVAANKANFTVVFDVETDHAWQDGNGNCLREGTGSVVKMENGPCDISDLSDNWTHSQGSNMWHNVYWGGEMYTNGDANGDAVLGGAPPLGGYAKWNAPT
jgi:hypothetical protein